MHENLGFATLAAGVDLERCPWMEFALRKLRTRQPVRPNERSDVFAFLDTVKDISRPEAPHVQYWTDHRCTNWCSAFVNWCVEQAGYRGTDDALALSWLHLGERCQARWGAIAVVTAPRHHVGFCVKRGWKNDGSSFVYILGGNQGSGQITSVNIDRFYLPGRTHPGCRIEYRLPVVKLSSGNRSVLASG